MKVCGILGVVLLFALEGCSYEAGCGYRSIDAWEMNALESELKERGVKVSKDADGTLHCASPDSHRLDEALASVKRRKEVLFRANGMVASDPTASACFESWLKDNHLDYERASAGGNAVINWVPSSSVSWEMGAAAYQACKSQGAQ